MQQALNIFFYGTKVALTLPKTLSFHPSILKEVDKIFAQLQYVGRT
jgi:hypothetical protein